MNEPALRQALVQSAKAMYAAGLNKGTAGNLSCRCGDGFLVTPSAIPVDAMTPESMVLMNRTGTPLSPGKPSSEWHFHCDILAKRPEVNAVVHCHSPFATTLACQRKTIPAFHYMIALAGGHDIRCAPYRLFGTPELSTVVVEALTDRQACLLANHGMVTLGKTLESAVSLAIEVESLCEIYWRTQQAGEPTLLTENEMQSVFERFADYRKPS